jgi:hypothetical protein
VRSHGPSALVINLARVRHAVWMSDFMGMPETRRDVVRRMVADARDDQQREHLAAQYDQRVRAYVSAYNALPRAPGGAPCSPR